LRRNGAEVTEACGGIEAAGLTRTNKYSAILTDLHMDTGDGYSLIGSIPPCDRSRVVIVTGCSEMLRDGAGATAFGVRFVLPKPCSMAAVIHAAGVAVAAGKCGCDGCQGGLLGESRQGDSAPRWFRRTVRRVA